MHFYDIKQNKSVITEEIMEKCYLYIMKYMYNTFEFIFKNLEIGSIQFFLYDCWVTRLS